MLAVYSCCPFLLLCTTQVSGIKTERKDYVRKDFLLFLKKRHTCKWLHSFVVLLLLRYSTILCIYSYPTRTSPAVSWNQNVLILKFETSCFHRPLGVTKYNCSIPGVTVWRVLSYRRRTAAVAAAVGSYAYCSTLAVEMGLFGFGCRCLHVVCWFDGFVVASCGNTPTHRCTAEAQMSPSCYFQPATAVPTFRRSDCCTYDSYYLYEY